MHIQPLSCNIYLPVWASVITRQSRPEQKVVFLALDVFRFDHLLSVCLLTGIQYYRKSYKTTARRHFPSWKCSSPTEESRHEENNKCYLITKQQGVWDLWALLPSNWRRTRCPPTAQPWEQEVEPNRKQEEGNEWWKKKGKLGGMGRTDREQLKWLVTLVWFTPQYPAAEDKVSHENSSLFRNGEDQRGGAYSIITVFFTQMLKLCKEDCSRWFDVLFLWKASCRAKS